VEPNPSLGKVLQSEEPNQQDNFAPLFATPVPFPKVDKEILDWCERYLAAKKNNLYTLYDLYKFYKS